MNILDKIGVILGFYGAILSLLLAIWTPWHVEFVWTAIVLFGWGVLTVMSDDKK